MAKAKGMKAEGIKIDLDKERTLFFDLNALCELEDEHGDLDEAFKNMKKMKVVRKFLYLGLVHEDDTLTEEKVGKMFHLGNMNGIVSKIAQAINAATPENEGKNV